MNMQEKKLQRKNSRGYYTITLWETVLQGPYSVDFTEEQARYQTVSYTHLDVYKRQEYNDEGWYMPGHPDVSPVGLWARESQD